MKIEDFLELLESVYRSDWSEFKEIGYKIASYESNKKNNSVAERICSAVDKILECKTDSLNIVFGDD
jgi:hypothetical protein